MEIKVKYQGQQVAQIDFKVFAVIEKMRDLGYRTFIVRSEVCKYEYFAKFIDETTEDYISYYPDHSFLKGNNCRITCKDLETITEVLNYYIHIRNVEESE